MSSDKPIVYTCFCTDVIHEGHLNLINEAKKYGDVIVGVLCDSEMVKYNRFPLKSTEERVELIKSIPGIKEVVIQNEVMYDNIVKELGPDYIIHGDNWAEDSMKSIRKNILKVLDEYGGQLIEIPYTFNPKVQKIDRQMREKLAMPELRRARLKKLLEMVPIVKTIEVHSGLTGLIAEKTVIADATSPVDEWWNIKSNRVAARHFTEMSTFHINEVTHMDVNLSQIFSPNVAVIPFVDHNDAVRASISTSSSISWNWKRKSNYGHD